MTEQRAEQTDPSTIDTGEPIAALRDLEEPPSSAFDESLRHRIHRRRLGADIGRLTWQGPIVVLAEFLSILNDLFTGRTTDESKKR